VVKVALAALTTLTAGATLTALATGATLATVPAVAACHGLLLSG